MIKYGDNNIGKVYLGSNSIGKAYYGSNLVFQKGIAPSPTVIDYIRRDGEGAYIDTGITPDETTRIIIWARNFSPGGIALAGSQVAVGDSSLVLSAYTQQNLGSIKFDYKNSNEFAYEQFDKLTGYHKYEFGQGVVKVDDETIINVAASTFSNNYNIYLFGSNRGGNLISSALPLDICAARIYKNGSLVRNYVPVSSPSVGFLDKVSGNYFYNAGTSSLSHGTFEINAYTPLDYIECTGQQWFDTGIYGRNGMSSVSRFMVKDTNNTGPALFGTMTSGTNGTYYLTQIYQSNQRFYLYIGSTPSYRLYDSSTGLLNRDVICYLEAEGAANLVDSSAHTKIGTGRTVDMNTQFVTPNTIEFGALKVGGEMSNPHGFIGRIYYMRFGTERNFVPAKVNNVIGMYDTYNDVFYSSETNTPFLEPSIND